MGLESKLEVNHISKLLILELKINLDNFQVVDATSIIY